MKGFHPWRFMSGIPNVIPSTSRLETTTSKLSISDGMVYAGWREAVGSGGGLIPIGQRLRGGGKPDEAMASQLTTLANFMITVDLARLTYLETASNGFQRTFVDSMDDIQMSDVDVLYTRLQDISDQHESVYAAIQAFESRMQQAASDSREGGGKQASAVLPRNFSGIWDALEQFFMFKNEEDEKAQEENPDRFCSHDAGRERRCFLLARRQKPWRSS